MKKSTNKNEKSYELIEFTQELPSQGSEALVSPLINQQPLHSKQVKASEAMPKISHFSQPKYKALSIFFAGSSTRTPNVSARKLTYLLSKNPLDFYNVLAPDMILKKFTTTEGITRNSLLCDVTSHFVEGSLNRAYIRNANGFIITADLTKISTSPHFDWRIAATELLANIKENFSYNGRPITPIFLVGMVTSIPFNINNFSEYSGFSQFVENNQLHVLSTIVNIEDQRNMESSIDSILKEIDRLTLNEPLSQNNNATNRENNSSCKLM